MTKPFHRCVRCVMESTDPDIEFDQPRNRFGTIRPTAVFKKTHFQSRAKYIAR